MSEWRCFKTAWFARAAKKANIDDDELYEAILQVMQGQADDLGGGVFKKRLNKNQHRSIIVAKGGKHWIYTYLFAKKDRDNINRDELVDFRKKAGDYSNYTDSMIDNEKTNGALEEIFYEQKTEI